MPLTHLNMNLNQKMATWTQHDTGKKDTMHTHPSRMASLQHWKTRLVYLVVQVVCWLVGAMLVSTHRQLD